MQKNPICILLADNDTAIWQELTDYLEMTGTTDISVFLETRGGSKVLDRIYRMCPDIILLNLRLEDLDGIGVLRRIRQNPPHKAPEAMMLLEEEQSVEASQAFLLGVNCCLTNPLDLPWLKERIRDAVSSRPGEEISVRDLGDLRSHIQEIVSRIGTPAHMLGYVYLIEAVQIIIEHPESVFLARDLYEKIAFHYHTNASCVESDLRNAIKAVKKIKNDEFWTIFFHGNKQPEMKLSNFQLISKLAEYVKLECS